MSRRRAQGIEFNFPGGTEKVETITDVLKTIDGLTEVVSIERGEVNLVMVFDHEAIVKKKERRIKRLYQLDDDGETIIPIDVDIIIAKLIERIEESVDVSELLREVFIKTPPDVLLEMYSRLLQNTDTTVHAGSGGSHCCYSLIISGKENEKELEVVINK